MCPGFVNFFSKQLYIGQQSAVPYVGILFGGWGSSNSVEDRENRDLRAVAP